MAGGSPTGVGRGGTGQKGESPPKTIPAVAASSTATGPAMDRGVEPSPAAEEEVAERTMGKKSTAFAPPSPSRFLQGAQEAIKKGLERVKSSSSFCASPLRTLHGGRKASKKGPGTAGAATSASENPTGGAAGEEGRSEQPAVALTRSQYAAMMRRALARIEGGDAGEEAAAFAEMEKAITGLAEITYGKVALQALPSEFATRWPHDDADPLCAKFMVDPVMLASGHSVDQSCYQGLSAQNNTCPVTNQPLPHSLVVPDHLLQDMITAWCLDHSIPHPSATADALSIPMAPPLEEQMPELLEKLSSGHSELQWEALHLIQLLSKASMGVEPALNEWPYLVSMLVDLQKKWKSTWTLNFEEERLATILNLSAHRPNREVLARQKKLPGALMMVIQRADQLGNPTSLFAKVAAAIAILSEFDMFRRRVLDIGGMVILRDLLRVEDVVVRKEASAAILLLCTDVDTKASAAIDGVPDAVLEGLSDGMVTDECLLLVDRLPKSQQVRDAICGQAEQLVNVIMDEHASGLITSQGIHSAVSLIHIVVQRDVGQMKKVNNLENFKECLRTLISEGMPMQTLFKVEEILSTLSEMFPHGESECRRNNAAHE